MSPKLAAALAALVLTAGAAAYAQNNDAFTDDEYEDPFDAPCSLFLDYDQEDVILVAYAAEGTSGVWSLTMTQGGEGGSANISQSGEFVPYEEDYGPVMLSEIIVDADTAFEVELTTESELGVFTCTLSH